MITLAELTTKVLKNLSKAEADALHALHKREVADFGDGQEIDLTQAEKWGPERTVSADFIRWLCSDPGEVKELKPYGIRITGAKIQGELNLAEFDIPIDVSLRCCFIPDPIDLRHTSLPTLDLSGSRTGRIDADSLTVAGDLRMAKGFRAQGPVCLREAVIKGDLACADGHFDNLNDLNDITRITGCTDCRASMLHCYALVLEWAKIDGSIFLCGGFSTSGGVHLGDSTIGVNLNCTKGEFTARSLDDYQGGTTTGRRLACEKDAEYHLACAFNGEGMHIKGNLIMNGVVVKGETRLTGATVDGDLDSAAGTYHHQGANAIHGDRLHVRGNAFLCDGFEARGAVRLPRAEIGADLSFYNGHLTDTLKHMPLLFCEGIRVQGTVYLKNLRAEDGYVDISYSSVGGNLDCSESTFYNPEGYAIKANDVEVKGALFLSSTNNGNFQATGLVSLTGCKLGMDLICRNGNFISEKTCVLEEHTPCAIKADNMVIVGKVDMSGERFRAKGGINLDDTKIGSFLICDQGSVVAPPFGGNFNCAISAGKLQVAGSIYFRKGFNSTGEVMLNDASIGRNLNLSKGTITREGGYTLRAKQIKVAGSINLDSFVSHGELNLDYSVIGGNLNCVNGSFVNEREISQMPESSSRDGKHYAFRADGARITGNVEFNEGFNVDGIVSLQNADIGMRLYWLNIKDQTSAALFLDAAKVGALEDEEGSWPEEGKLQINDFEYRFLKDLSPSSLKNRRETWLALPIDFRTQPYEHLASVLRRSGYEEEAKEVLIEKHRAQMQLPINWSGGESQSKDEYRQGLRPLTWVSRRVYGMLVCYGYKPLRAVIIGLFLVLVGWGLFYAGFRHDIMVPTQDKDKAYIYQTAQVDGGSFDKELKTIINDSGLYSLVYTVDTFLPVVDLHAAEYWLPTDHLPGEKLPWLGAGLCLYRWLLIASGWVLSICYGAALSGIVRR